MALAPSKKTNALFLEKNCAIARDTRAYMLRGLRAKKSKQNGVGNYLRCGDEEIQFLSSLSLPNLRQALGKNFLHSDSEYEDYTSDSDDGSENILDKSCGKDASGEDFPVRRMKRFAGKKGVELPKKFEGKSGRKRGKTSRNI